jgi:hypothetical protein
MRHRLTLLFLTPLLAAAAVCQLPSTTAVETRHAGHDLQVRTWAAERGAGEYAAWLENHRVQFARSVAGGVPDVLTGDSSWDGVQQLSSAEAHCSHLRMDADEVLVAVAYERSVAPGQHRIELAWSRDAGQTWTRDVVVSGPTHADCRLPSIAVDLVGIHVAYLDQVTRQVFVNNCTFSGGCVFASEAQLSTEPAEIDNGPRIGSSAFWIESTEVYAVWYGATTAAKYAHATLTPTAHDWSPEAPICPGTVPLGESRIVEFSMGPRNGPFYALVALIAATPGDPAATGLLATSSFNGLPFEPPALLSRELPAESPSVCTSPGYHVGPDGAVVYVTGLTGEVHAVTMGHEASMVDRRLDSGRGGASRVRCVGTPFAGHFLASWQQDGQLNVSKSSSRGVFAAALPVVVDGGSDASAAPVPTLHAGSGGVAWFHGRELHFARVFGSTVYGPGRGLELVGAPFAGSDLILSIADGWMQPLTMIALGMAPGDTPMFGCPDAHALIQSVIVVDRRATMLFHLPETSTLCGLTVYAQGFYAPSWFECVQATNGLMLQVY